MVRYRSSLSSRKRSIFAGKTLYIGLALAIFAPLTGVYIAGMIESLHPQKTVTVAVPISSSTP